MKEYSIQKPTAIAGYPIHRAVAALTSGAQHTWRDNGDAVLIRTMGPMGMDGAELPAPPLGEIRLFSLRACVCRKVRGRHIYPKVGDNQARQAWLERQGLRHGFSVVTVFCSSEVARVTDHTGRNFTLDSTDFTGALKVTDADAFQGALRTGVGGTGRAFGFSLLSV